MRYICILVLFNRVIEDKTSKKRTKNMVTSSIDLVIELVLPSTNKRGKK